MYASAYSLLEYFTDVPLPCQWPRLQYKVRVCSDYRMRMHVNVRTFVFVDSRLRFTHHSTGLIAPKAWTSGIELK
jgi:hypothetical protein